MPPWLAILGIGEDGVEGLAPAARTLLASAELVYGGARHLALAAGAMRGEARPWPSPLDRAIPEIVARRGRPVAVLASGDPFCYGIGALLLRSVAAEEAVTVPAPSVFSLATARLGWSRQDVATISFCGRPIAALAPLLQPGARILALSEDETTPATVAASLRERGFGPSTIHVLEALGGPRERRRAATADGFGLGGVDPLNMLALDIAAGPDARIVPLASGLPDELFEHDGQITKREIRAVTLSTLAPRAGETLWDIGCGSGSVGIEWLLRHPANRAVGLEKRSDRAERAARNALALGVPRFDIRIADAPAGFDGLPDPDAIFVGGGARSGAILDEGWRRLKRGGRMVANAVAIETEAVLLAALESKGGTLTRLSVERLDGLGRLRGFRPAMTVTQWSATKP